MSALRSLLLHARLLRPRRHPSIDVSTRHDLPRRAAITPAKVRFSRARLERLRQILGAPNDGLLPPIAVQLLASPLHLELLAEPSFPLRALGLVHVSNTIDEHRALPDGLALELEAFVEALVSTPRGDEVTLVTEARVDGELVYRAVTKALQKAKQAAPRTTARAAHASPSGELARRAVIEVPEATGRRYARVAGDLNPIHQHAWLARPFGFPRAIVHGTWTLSRALEVGRAELPQWPRTIECNFRKPVLLPSAIAVEACRSGDALELRVSSPSDPAWEHLSARVRRLA